MADDGSSVVCSPWEVHKGPPTCRDLFRIRVRATVQYLQQLSQHLGLISVAWIICYSSMLLLRLMPGVSLRSICRAMLLRATIPEFGIRPLNNCAASPAASQYSRRASM